MYKKTANKMSNFLFFRTISSLLKLNQNNRRILIIAIDSILLPLVIFFSFWVYSDTSIFELTKSDVFWIIPTILILGISLFVLTGQYRGLSKYLNSKAFYFLLLRNTFLIFFVIIFGKIFGLTLLKFKNWIILWFILNFTTSFVRVILRDLQIFLGFLQAKSVKKNCYLWSRGGRSSFIFFFEVYLRLANNSIY